MSANRLPKPLTKPVTAYEFFDRLTGVMREEPARVNQGTWLERGWKLQCSVEDGSHHAKPACGTVGCTAGWASVLLGYRSFPSAEKIAEDLGMHFLSVDEYDNIKDRLFAAEGYNSDIPVDECDYNGNPTYKSGTRQHMRLVVGGIKQFMKDHRDSLKRILVYPKGTR